MDADLLLLEVGLDEAGKAPTEFLMFGAGVTTTTKGPVVYDLEAGVEVLTAYERRGLDRLPIDVAHGMLQAGGGAEQHKAFGWFVPAAREDGLYASSVEWTDEGRRMVEAREFRYFSPAVMIDPESARVTEVINLALTNIPATNNQRPLVAERDPMLEQAIKLLSLADGSTADDVAAAIVTLQSRTEADAALLSALDAEAKELRDEIAALHAEKAKTERAFECDRLGLQGPARDYAMALSAEAFPGFAALAAAKVSLLSHSVTEPQGDAAGRDIITDEQRKIARLLNLDPAKVFAGKDK